MAETLVERRLEDGVLVELWQRDEAWEVRCDGSIDFASDARRSEKAFAELALAPWQGRDDISVLLGGLATGHTLRAVLDIPGVSRVDVIEVSPAVVEWEAKHFAVMNGCATRDPRVTLHNVELSKFLGYPRSEITGLPEGGWFACLLDLDEWPDRLSRPGNHAFYTREGLERLEAALRPGGVLGVWTAQKDGELLTRMTARLQGVTQVAVPVDVRGAPGLDYVYRARRRPRRQVN
jgi:spermidine synthase